MKQFCSSHTSLFVASCVWLRKFSRLLFSDSFAYLKNRIRADALENLLMKHRNSNDDTQERSSVVGLPGITP